MSCSVEWLNKPIVKEDLILLHILNIDEIAFDYDYNYPIPENILPDFIKKLRMYCQSNHTLNSIPITIEHLELVYNKKYSSDFKNINNLHPFIQEIKISGEKLTDYDIDFVMSKIKIPFECKIFDNKDERIL